MDGRGYLNSFNPLIKIIRSLFTGIVKGEFSFGTGSFPTIDRTSVIASVGDEDLWPYGIKQTLKVDFWGLD